MDTLTSQMVALREAEGALWNPRGKLLVVVADSDCVSPKELCLQIYAELWKEHFIIDNTILTATRDKCVKINSITLTDLERTLCTCKQDSHTKVEVVEMLQTSLYWINGVSVTESLSTAPTYSL